MPFASFQIQSERLPWDIETPTPTPTYGLYPTALHAPLWPQPGSMQTEKSAYASL